MGDDPQRLLTPGPSLPYAHFLRRRAFTFQ